MRVQYWEIVHDKCIIRAGPRLSAACVDVKLRGDTVPSSAITFDGWIKLANGFGWMLTDMRGRCDIGEVLRPIGEDAIKLPVEGYYPQGLCCLEVVFQKVFVRESPDRKAIALSSRMRGELVFASAQNFDGWIKLADEAGWMLVGTPDFGELLRPRSPDDTKGIDLRVLSNLWCVVRSKAQSLLSSQVEVLRHLESRAAWRSDFDFVREGQSDNGNLDADLRCHFAQVLERLVMEDMDDGPLRDIQLTAWQSIVAVMPEPPIHVHVMNLAGRLLELRMETNAKVSDLKIAIAKAWRIPPLCQQLYKDAYLQDAVQLSSLSSALAWADVQTLSLNLVVSVESVLKDLEGEDQARRKAALKSLAIVGSRGGNQAVLAVVRGLSDYDPQVRSVTTQFLAYLKDDEQALEMMKACLNHGNWNFRVAALRALVHFEYADADGIYSAIKACLSDEEGEVRAEAIRALARICPINDPNTFAAARACLADRDRRVIAAAIEATRMLEQMNRSEPILRLV